ncbi:nifU-like protein 4, mitochondrial isoform X2 [Beta vulgaris subsp. vulgaris]|uniref:nifU-like protein 4, mitochondrial isoform X2 n=1 Tax=Beta vulgaris subsp. vulgaris TaxID=3555 RepID=UPI002036DBB5|nr:nifU-like protein 4, mitochondrial isoform X2 [Beta vulgaris subsp. vulgaris]
MRGFRKLRLAHQAFMAVNSNPLSNRYINFRSLFTSSSPFPFKFHAFDYSYSPNFASSLHYMSLKPRAPFQGVTRVFFGSDFVTVTKSDDASWDILKPEIFAAVMDFYTSGQPLFLDESTAASKDTAIHEDDSETVAMIKELLETRIRPAVQDDGGDIVYKGFDLETGIVKLQMQGACSGCPSSSVTLKSGIENMLMHYVPEVKGVEQELDAEDEEATALE